MNPIFSTVTIMVKSETAANNPESRTSDGKPDDTFRKIHRLCHERLNIPVVWLLADAMIEVYGETLKEWAGKYGDQVGIYEPGIYGKELAGVSGQYWPEAAGIERPERTNGLQFQTWADMPEETQRKAIGYLKQRLDKAIGQNTTLMYAANAGANTVRAMASSGINILWGYNWNLYGDGVDATGKGCPPFPFFVSPDNQKAPAAPGDTTLLGAAWGAGDLSGYSLARTSKIGLNNMCINPHELANRSGRYDSSSFAEKVIDHLVQQSIWNPFSYIPLQCEAEWLDETGYSYAQHPAFNAHSSEALFHLIETVLRKGGRMVTHDQLRAWLRERFDRTPEMIYYGEDLTAGETFRGKDQDFPPILIYQDQKRQDIFLKSQGFNHVRSYSYDPVKVVKDPRLEYPFRGEPNVELQIKEWTSPIFGVTITPEKAYYSAEDLVFTAGQDEPDYACALWSAFVPDCVAVEDLETSSNISRIRLLREKNIALVFATLNAGDNRLRIYSDKPKEFISIDEQAMSGTRYEIYIQNTGPAVWVSHLKTRIDSHLRVGGFWWNGKYHQSIFHYHYSPYDWRTGDLAIKTAYPIALELPEGTTRCSIEVLGRLGE